MNKRKVERQTSKTQRFIVLSSSDEKQMRPHSLFTFTHKHNKVTPTSTIKSRLHAQDSHAYKHNDNTPTNAVFFCPLIESRLAHDKVVHKLRTIIHKFGIIVRNL